MKAYHLHNRPDRELTDTSDINAILQNGKFLTISMCRDNEPYIVTLSYGYDAEKEALYFHCSQNGLKIDFLNANKNVCATVIEDGGYIMDECAHEYRSLVFWGEMHVVDDIEEKKHGMSILLEHLEENDTAKKRLMLKSDDRYPTMNILRLDIKEIHGKAGR